MAIEKSKYYCKTFFHKIYLRPIQKSLSTKPLVQQRHSDVKEKYHMCDQEILVHNLRELLYTCTVGLHSDAGDDTSSTTVSGTPSTSAVSRTTSNTPTTSEDCGNTSSTRSTSAVSGNTSSIPSTSTVSGNTSSTPSTSAVSGNTSITNNVHSDGTTMTSNEAPQALAVPYVDLTEQTSNRHQSLNTVQEVVQATCTVSVTPIFLCLQRGGGGGGGSNVFLMSVDTVDVVYSVYFM